MLPDELERRQIFHTLKRWSSYTAWARILDFYQTWADAMERTAAAIDELPDGSPAAIHCEKVAIGTGSHVQAQIGLAHCDEGVSRLRAGDKRVFKYDVNGEFVMARRPLDFWGQFMGREVAQNGWPLQPELIPHWDELEQARIELEAAWSECSPWIIESDDLDDPAPAIYGVWLQEWLPRMAFPSPLPDVPPLERTTVVTGEEVPFSGIWEPTELVKKNIVQLFSAPTPAPMTPVVGCMNYLHGGSEAPRAKQETDTESLRANVRWRLVWRDDRYEDGRVPAEEDTYRFLAPAIREQSVTLVPRDEDALLSAPSGAVAVKAGVWAAEHELHLRVVMALGDVLPDQDGRAIQWVYVGRA